MPLSENLLMEHVIKKRIREEEKLSLIHILIIANAILPLEIEKRAGCACPELWQVYVIILVFPRSGCSRNSGFPP